MRPRGNHCRRSEDHREAIACLDVAVGLSPDYPFAHATKGISLQALGRHQEAVACFDETLRLDPKNAFAYGDQGKIATGAWEIRGVVDVP